MFHQHIKADPTPTRNALVGQRGMQKDKRNTWKNKQLALYAAEFEQ